MWIWDCGSDNILMDTEQYNMENKLLFSVVIPTYNRIQLLRRALESVFAQTLDRNKYEVIVVDDGSTDNTKEILKDSNIIDRIKYIYQSNCGLQSIVRNRGIQVAKGRYIAFLDSDDEWLPSKLEKQADILMKDSKCALVCTNAYLIKDEIVTNELYTKNQNLFSGNVFFKLLHNNFIINSSVVVRKKALLQSGVFDENKSLKSLEDYDLWLRLGRSYPIVSLSEPLTLYRIHAGNISKDVLQTYRGLIQIYHKLERSEKLSRYEYIRILFEKYRTGLHAIKTALKKKEYRYLKTFLL